MKNAARRLLDERRTLGMMTRKALPSFAIAWLCCAMGCGQDVADGSAAILSAEHTGTQALTQECSFDGTWALKFDIPVSWRFNMGISSGTGTIEQWALLQRRTLDGTTIEETVRPCGSAIPTYRALPIYGGEHYGVAFEDALFDSGVLPTLTAVTQITGRRAGDSFDIAPIPLSLGVNLPDPQHDAWPKRSQDLQRYVTDSDADGAPGVTAVARQDGELVLPPVNTTKSHRARKFHIALRNLIGARGHIDSCDKFIGEAVVAQMNGKPAIQSTILGCELSDQSLCTRGQATLANTFQPSYRLEAQSRAVMVRVDDSTTCAQVRATHF